MSITSLAQMLGRVPSGVFILTARHEDQETGMLASWVMQAGFEPPMVTVAVNLRRYLVDWLALGKPFVLNSVGVGQKELLSHFGRGFEPGQPAFEGVDVERTADGLAVLSTALGALECRPVKHVDSGDHRVFLAEVTAGRVINEQDPMVHIRRDGLKY